MHNPKPFSLGFHKFQNTHTTVCYFICSYYDLEIPHQLLKFEIDVRSPELFTKLEGSNGLY